MYDRIVLSLVVAVTCNHQSPRPPLSPPPTSGQISAIASWHHLTYATPPGYPGCVAPYYDLRTSIYTSNKSIIFAIEPSDTRYYLSMPRFRGPTGYPCTLGFIDKPDPGCSIADDTPIQAYPNWDWHQDAESDTVDYNCSALVSVAHAQIDQCNRLWALDTGLTDIQTFTMPCPPKIVIFDLNTDQHVKSIVIPKGLAHRDSIISYLVLDESKNYPTCDATRVYISDCGTNPGVLVYDGSSDTIIRRTTQEMYPNPDFKEFTAANGEVFHLMRGINSVLPAPALDCDTPSTELAAIYFNPYTSNEIYKTTLGDLLSGEYDSLDPAPFPPVLPTELVTYIPSQTATLILSRDNRTIIFVTLTEDTVWSYDPHAESLRSLVTDRLIEGSLDIECDGDTLLILSTNLPRYFNATLDDKDINHRILAYTSQEVSVYNPPPYYSPHGSQHSNPPQPSPPAFNPQHQPLPGPPQYYPQNKPQQNPQYGPIYSINELKK